MKKKATIVKKRNNFFTVHAKTCMLHPSSEAKSKDFFKKTLGKRN